MRSAGWVRGDKAVRAPGEGSWAPALLCFVLTTLVSAAETNTNTLPPAAAVNVVFDRDIRPILEQSCLRCHGPEKPKSHFRLTTREWALKGGDDNADDIVPGDSGRSHLVQYVAGMVADIQMPPPGKAPPVTPSQTGLLRAWIDQGANWTTTNAAPQIALSFSPALRWTGVEGNKAKFREIEGYQEEAGGGVERFSWDEQDTPDTKFSAEGHFLVPDQDLQLKLAWTKTDVGFVDAGFERWRKYDDDTGGYAPLMAPYSFTLGRELYLDNGRAWLDTGLSMPEWPRIVVGYEYQFKDGDESTLQWGAVGTNAAVFSPDTRNVFPASKHIYEAVHILKLDLNYNFAGWQLEDNARLEFYKLETGRQDVLADSLGSPPNVVATINETDRHTQGANTFNVNGQLADWLSVSGGYYYSHLEGDASVGLNTQDSTGFYYQNYQWSADDVVLRRQSQVASVAALAGPWQGLTLSTCVQGEWTRQESMGFEDLRSSFLPSSANDEIGTLDSTDARENASLRFTKIPFTVLFAETRLEQESVRRFDQGYIQSFSSFGPFTNHSDTDIESEEYRVGFTTSPCQRLSFSASFKHGDKHTDYGGTNTLIGDYPGFIQWRDLADDQVETRLVFRAASWLVTSFNFRCQKTDFDSATVVIPGFTGGPIEAGDEEAHAYSANAVVRPLPRFYLSGTFSWSDSRITTAFDGTDGLVPWRGNVYTVLSSASYALNPKTGLTASCLYSRSDYGQNNLATLPAGIDFCRIGLQAGITHRFANNVVAGFRYSFSHYRDSTLGGADDFTAHSIFATATIPWP